MCPRTANQRHVVRQVIETADRPLSPQEILKLAHVKQPTLGIATVYRAVKAGTEQGWLVPVEMPHGPTRYEPAGKAHHHHFECTDCHAVFGVEGCPGPMNSLVPKGAELTDHEIFLYGRCADCREPSSG
ncbi:Fur family transcriptional regulator [Algisphaera agarilytica]|uniref:Fur family ferric uptake transcriptional regulator n=1 Tax=Algisphaera agarilytica TaxID=1385975 RepID=A0A7X0LKQ8_9BACT|nr:transcriptional repressor [Algisphaera agarilytica]MBB6429886.1 Fur family ferric uptake transcriptional regulator [Algisphaera agarilytica]